MKRLEDELEYTRGLGFDEGDYRFLSADELRDTLKVDQALGAILMSHCAAIHPARLARGLAETVEDLGVRLYEQSPVLELGGGQLRTPHGTVTAGITLLATEGYSSSLPGHKRRLVPVHSMMVATEPLSEQQIDSHLLAPSIDFHKPRPRHHLRPTDGGQAYRLRLPRYLSFRFAQYKVISTQEDPEFDLVRQTLIRFFPALEGIGFTHAWGGAMGVSRTLQPAIHFDRDRRLGWAGG